MTAKIGEQEIRIVAAIAGVDPRTVRRLLEVGPSPRQSAVVRAAIVRALRERGHKAEAARLERAGAK